MECIAKHKYEDIDDHYPLFKSEEYCRVMNHFDISTSTVKSEFLKTGGFGPPENHMIAIPYQIDNKKLSIGLCFFDVAYGGVDGDGFHDCLLKTIDKMVELFQDSSLDST